MRDFSIVFNYYLKKELKSKAFIIITIVLCIVSFASCFIVNAIGSSSEKRDLFVVDNTNQINLLLQKANLPNDFFSKCKLNFDYEDKNISREDIEKLVLDEEKSFAVFENVDNAIKLTIIDSGKVNDSDIQKLLYASQELIRNKNINEVGITAEQLDKININISLEKLNPSKKVENFWITYILYMLMVIIIVMYAATSAGEIGYLKTNKVMEILTTSSKPLPLYLGVTLSYGFSAFIQIGLVILSGVLSVKLSGIDFSGLESIGIVLAPMASLDVIIYMLYFIFGFLFFSFINTALASIVNQTEDLSMTILPVEMLAMVQFFLSLYTLEADGIVSAVCSYIPITSPAVMFVRYMMGYTGITNVVISLAILISFVILFAIIGAKLFCLGVVHFGTIKEFKIKK